jgi:hypothetical protein
MKFLATSALFLITLAILFEFGSSVMVNLESCKGKKDISIKDSQGSELKRICEVREKKTYAQAEAHCRKNGMNLLMIDKTTIFSAFSDYMKKTYPIASQWSSSKGVWINGRRKEDDYSDDVVNNWSVFDPNERDLDYNALKWTHGSGDCLSFIGPRLWKASAYRCSQLFYFVCEINPLFLASKCPEPVIMNCDDIKKEREKYKKESMTCHKSLLDKNLEHDELKIDYEEHKRANEHKDKHVREMAGKLAGALTEIENLQGKLSKCKK